MCITWWDGIYQWPPTPVNTTISIECHKIFEMTMGEQSNDREFLYQQKHHYAERKCLANGQWGWNNWTNYTECLNLLAQQVTYNTFWSLKYIAQHNVFFCICWRNRKKI